MTKIKKSITIPEEVVRQIEQIREKQNRTFSAQIAHMLIQVLKQEGKWN